METALMWATAILATINICAALVLFELYRDVREALRLATLARNDCADFAADFSNLEGDVEDVSTRALTLDAELAALREEVTELAFQFVELDPDDVDESEPQSTPYASPIIPAKGGELTKVGTAK
jgi:hypothetical protein